MGEGAFFVERIGLECNAVSVALALMLCVLAAVLSSGVFVHQSTRKKATAHTAALADLTIAELLTVVIVTSPNHTNPDTTVIRYVLSSFDLVPQLEAARLIIVCDGYTTDVEPSNAGALAGTRRTRKRPEGAEERTVHRKGVLSPLQAAEYGKYCVNLRKMLAREGACEQL